MSASKDEIRGALRFIPANDRKVWVDIGMAVKSELPNNDGFKLWDEWSETAKSKYDKKAAAAAWESFSPLTIKIGTLFHHAKQHGWRPEPKKRSKPSTPPKEDARYTYTDEESRPVMQVRRLEWPAINGSKPDKTFVQYRPDGAGGWLKGVKGHGIRLVPYRLSELIKAIAAERVVFIVEGEKHVDRLMTLDIPATTNPMGAGKWWPELTPHFRGADIVILPDNDADGRGHAIKVVGRIKEVAKRLRVLELPGLPDKGDVIDWLEAGGTRDQLLELAKAAKDFAAASANDNDSTAANDNWHDQLVQRKGITIPIEANFITELHHDADWNGVFDFNKFSAETSMRKPIPQRTGSPPKDEFPRPWTDCDTAAALDWFQKGDYPRASLMKVQTAVDFVSQTYRSFHPVQDYLNALRWDGEPRIDRWLETYCHAEIEDGDAREFIGTVGAKWLISGVARIFEPGCQADHVLVLEGKQGCGKTSAFRILGDRWFSESLPGDLYSKDAQNHVRGKWIIELAELKQLRHSEREALKAFLSRNEERFRPAYGRNEITYRRQCIFGGSTNESQYLADPTGARRFWPVEVGTIDLDGLRRDRDQLWAEAVHRYRQGEKWWITDPWLEACAEVRQAARHEADPWEERILEFVADLRETTIHSILDRGIGMVSSRQELVSQKRVAAILKLNRWVQKRTGRARKWVRSDACDA
jgi:predicted P-loop ATPase